MNFTNKLISKSGHLIHKLKAKDSTGRWAYYLVFVQPFKEDSFLNAINSNGPLDLEDYGIVIGSCYGEKISGELKNEIYEKYQLII